MTVLLARLKQAAVWIAALAILVGAATWALLRRRRFGLSVESDPVDVALARYERRTEQASARAAVEIAVARTQNAAERDELLDILKDQDEDRQADRLIAAARKVRGE